MCNAKFSMSLCVYVLKNYVQAGISKYCDYRTSPIGSAHNLDF